jgi:hypothetical protein
MEEQLSGGIKKALKGSSGQLFGLTAEEFA